MNIKTELIRDVTRYLLIFLKSYNRQCLSQEHYQKRITILSVRVVTQITNLISFRREGSNEVGKLPGSFKKEFSKPKTRGRNISTKPLTERDAKGRGRMPLENQDEEKPNNQYYFGKDKSF
ncbi:hypothetical protein HI914_05280 [Erysiphe necator]|nr:hypothetical protein HI914_05280 [Erysiphe necator]